MNILGEYRGYNQTVNPSIANVFATAAMRFGHTLVNRHLVRHFSSSAKKLTDEEDEMRLKKVFFTPHLLMRPGLIDSILKGLLVTALKKPRPEQAVTEELTDHLFESSRYIPLDLAAINIQRGRDHALPGYNRWREFCGLNRAETFDALRYEIPNDKIRARLQRLYGHPDNVDLWVGGILEESAADAKVGPTFRCLLVDQFRRLRDGDRFFYQVRLLARMELVFNLLLLLLLFQNPTVFSEAQRLELEKTTLAGVVCRNSDNLTSVLGDAFSLPGRETTSWIACDQLPEIDLRRWTE